LSNTSISLANPTLTLTGTKAYTLCTLLVGAAIVLPAIAHLTGAPVRILLPMHWPVILAGFVYGLRGGLIAGAASPILSYLISGMPLPWILPSMTVELAVYGSVTGFLRQYFRWNGFASVATALLAGRLAFVAAVIFTGGLGAGFAGYISSALVPGLIAGVLQIALLPLLGNWWVKQESSR
jgi:riboflavin transporter FmnP